MPATVQKPCKICGKLFTPCADCEQDKAVFRWKSIACSQKCAKAYFAKIEESRLPQRTSTPPTQGAGDQV